MFSSENIASSYLQVRGTLLHCDLVATTLRPPYYRLRVATPIWLLRGGIRCNTLGGGELGTVTRPEYLCGWFHRDASSPFVFNLCNWTRPIHYVRVDHKRNDL